MKVTKKKISINNVTGSIKRLLMSRSAMDVMRLPGSSSREIRITKTRQKSEHGTSERWERMKKLKKRKWQIS